MLIKIKRQDCIKQFPDLPRRIYNHQTDEEEFFFPKVFAIYTLMLPSKSFRGNATLMGKEITSLTQKLGFNELIFLGDVDIAWRYRTHDYKPAMEGLQYLADNKLGKKFDGGLLVDVNELPVFIKHLSWMVRCNAVLAEIYFTDPGQNIIGDLCKYGNLHLQVKTKSADINCKSIIAESKFEFLTEGNCYNKFSRSSAIPGRQIII